MNKILSFKKIVSVGFFAAFLAVFLSVGTVKAETTYKWVNNGSVSKSDSRKTGDCSTKKQVTTYTCNSSTKGNKLYDGTNKGPSYGDTGHAWPIYEGENTSTATEYTYNSDNCTETVHKESGTVNEWECKSSDSTTSSGSSSSAGSASSVSRPIVTTGSAINITSNSATISATINNGGAASVDAYLYYAKSGDSSWTQAVGKTLSGSDDQDISADITGLSAGTKYYYLAYARNRNNTGEKNGSKKSFTTLGSSSSASSKTSSSSSSSVQQYTLKAKISGAGQITSSGGSGVINCKKSIDSKGKSEISGECAVKFNKGESVTLTVSTPSTKYEFATWADACRASQKLSSCAIVMSGDKTVSATFNAKGKSGEKTVSVSIRKTGVGVGKVVSIISAGKNSGKEDGAINCGSNCSQNYKQYCNGDEYGNSNCGMVYFRAVAEKGSTFGGWGGDCATFKNAKDQCYVTLDGDKTINASFNEGSNNPEGKYYDLTVTVSAGGKIESADNKISCDSSNSPCKYSYGKNGTVTLKTTPNSGYILSSTGGCNIDKTKNSDGSYTCKVKMTKNQNVTINFKASGSSSSSSSSQTSSSSANHTASTTSATNITSTSATLNGTVNPNGENVAYIFSYYKKGTSETSWKNTSWKSVSGSGEVSASADITGLSSGASYYYILQAYSYSTKKTVNGGGKSFTTSGSSSNSSSSSSSSNITLKITLSGTGSVYRDGYGNLGCGTDQAPATSNICTQTITKDSTEHSLTGFSGSLKSWSGCDSVEGSTCKFKADGDKNITATFN